MDEEFNSDFERVDFLIARINARLKELPSLNLIDAAKLGAPMITDLIEIVRDLRLKIEGLK